MRFCPRCGFQLGAVIALMAGGGLPVAMSGAHLQCEKPSARKRGIRQGAKLMFVSGVLLPIALFLSSVTNRRSRSSFRLQFLAGLALNLYSRLFAGRDGSIIPINHARTVWPNAARLLASASEHPRARREQTQCQHI